MKKVLIAGGAGYVGTVLCDLLIDRGYDVTAADLLWFGNKLNPKVNLINKNIRDLRVDDVADQDVVIFIAGVSNDPMAEFKPEVNFVENSATPAYLAYITRESCKKPKRFIYGSTCSVYGYTQNKLMNESAEVSPKFPYGISKLLGEQGVMSLEDECFRPIALRKGTVGGWSPRMRFDLVVNTMTKFALMNGALSVHNPALWRPLVDIRDAAFAYLRSIESDLSISGVYNVSYGNYTIGRLADEIKETLLEDGIEVTLEVEHRPDMRNYKVSNRKAKLELDFCPRYSPKDSVREILKHTKGLDLTGKQYHNIEVFKELDL